MAELTAAEVYAPRPIQVWRALLNWMAFFFQIFAQIIRGTPSFAQVLSYVGLRHSSLLSSASHAPPQFKPLPVEELTEYGEEVEEAPPPPPPTSVPIVGGGGTVMDALPLEKLKEKVDHKVVMLSLFQPD